MAEGNGRKRYAHVGLGGRAKMYVSALADRFKDEAELVAMCDANQTRMDYYNGLIEDKIGRVPTYPAADFDRMIGERKPDWVIVTTKDCHHHEYIVRAMELGCDVITEKPMTTDAGKCQAILDARKRTGRRIVVTFNYRWSPIRAMAKKAVMEGELGEIRSVDFNWLLNQRHGADYYRRWHRNKENSGGLLVHKSTHHFDLVNWWVDSQPESVFAFGRRKYATPEQAESLGLEGRGERCLDCPVGDKCLLRLDLNSAETLKNLYLNAEHEDGYFRDRCVFSDSIDIEDSMSVTVRYRNGVLLTYSLNTFLPYEGYVMTINGTKARLEMNVRETSYVSGDGTPQGELMKGSSLRIFPVFGEPYDVEIPESRGGHGGGDLPLLESIFSDEPPEDPYHCAASEFDGAMSILTGIAANRSIETGEAVEIDRLVRF